MDAVGTHSLGVEVLFDGEAVHHTGGPALLDAGQENEDQGKHAVVHSDGETQPLGLVLDEWYATILRRRQSTFSLKKKRFGLPWHFT